MSNEFLDTGVDTAGFLAGLLTGYEPTSILREQTQNADDACAKVGAPGWLKVSFSQTHLTIENPSILSRDDWRRLAKTSSRGKANDAEQTGEFGVGFWSVLHLTDAPSIKSGKYRATIDQLSGKQAEIQEMPDAHLGTVFDLKLRSAQTESSIALNVQPVTPTLLDHLEHSFEEQIPDLLLFAKSLTRIELRLRDGSTVVGKRQIVRAVGAVETVTVQVESGRGIETTSFLCMRGAVPNAPEGRSPEVAVAFPVDDTSDLAGRIFCTFPTETVTGLPFSINAHFYAAMDRRSIAHFDEKGHWNDEVFKAAGSIVGSGLVDLFESPGPSFDERLMWFVPDQNGVPQILRRRDFCLAEIDQEARTKAVFQDRYGISRRGQDLVLLDSTADRLLGTEIEQSAPRPDHGDLVDLYLRWGVCEWSRSDVARWVSANTPPLGTDLESAPNFMSSVSSLRQLLQYLAPVRDELGSACLALGSDSRLYPIGSVEIPKATGQMQRLVEGLSTPVLHAEMSHTIASNEAPTASADWFQKALLRESETVIGRTFGSIDIECFRSLNTIKEALSVFVDAQYDLTGLPLAVDSGETIHAVDSTWVVGLPTGSHRSQTAAFLRRVGLNVLHEELDDRRLVRCGVQRLTHRILMEAVQAADSWDRLADTGTLLSVCSHLLDEGIVDSSDVREYADLMIWPTASGATVKLGDLCIPAPDREIRSDQAARVISKDLCDHRSEQGKLTRRILEDVFDRVPLDAAEEAVIALENPPVEPARLHEAIEDLVRHWPTLRAVQKERVRSASFVPCEDQHRRRPADVLILNSPLPLELGKREIVATYRRDRRLCDILIEFGAQRKPTMDELVQLANSISSMEVMEKADPGEMLWEFLKANVETILPLQLERLGIISWMPCDSVRRRCRPVDAVIPALGYAKLIFPIARGVGNPDRRLRNGLGLRATLGVEDLERLASAASDEGVRLEPGYFMALEQRAAAEPDRPRVGRMRDVKFLPVGGGLLAPQELVSPKRGELWGDLKVPIDQSFVVKYPHLSTVWGLSDTEEPTWSDHLNVLSALAPKSELSPSHKGLARRRMKSLADALSAGEVQVIDLENRRCILTTNGQILRPAEALLPDVPKSVLDQIRDQVPVIDIPSIDVGVFVSQLPVGSVREAVDLEPDTEGGSQEAAWRQRLAVHRHNIFRFLRHVRADLPDDWAESWPPLVERVRSLRVRAFYGDRQVAEWEDTSFLAMRQGVLRLLVKGDETTVYSIVNAIATLYGIEAGKKSLLVSVLQKQTASEGEEALEFDQIPELRSDDPWESIEPVVIDLDRNDQLWDPAADVVPAGTENDGVSEASSIGAEAEQAEIGEPFTTENEPDQVIANLVLPPVEVVEPFDVVSRQPLPDSKHQPGSRPSAPRVPTQWDALQDDYEIQVVWESPGDEVDLGNEHRIEADARGRRSKCVLSFYDCVNGLLPLRESDSRAIAGPGGVQTVTIFGKEYAAQQADELCVAIEGGRELFLENEIVPGTVVHLRAGRLGRIELDIKEQVHEVSDVWILELDDEGKLRRDRLDSVTVRWETDGPLYKCERRWEDLEALHVEATASALDLIVRVFENFGHDGLTLEEVWSYVALNRLFAISTIRSELYRQDGMFTCDDGTWRQTGQTLKRYRGGRSQRAGSVRTSNAKPAMTQSSDQNDDERIMKAARNLGNQLRDSSDELRQTVGRVLGLRVVAMQDEREFELTVSSFLNSTDDDLYDSITRDMSRHPELSNIAVTVLEGVPTLDINPVSQLLDAIVKFGVSGAIRRAKDLQKYSLSSIGEGRDDVDAVTKAEVACAHAAELRTSWATAQQLTSDAYRTSCAAPYEKPDESLDELVRLERLIRRHVQLLSSQVKEERDLCLARIDASLGDTYAHLDAGRQGLLATIQLLRGDDAATLDALFEYAKFLTRAEGGSPDSIALFKLVDLFAKEIRETSAVARFAAQQVAAAQEKPAAPSRRTAAFIRDWCEMARLRPPV